MLETDDQGYVQNDKNFEMDLYEKSIQLKTQWFAQWVEPRCDGGADVGLPPIHSGSHLEIQNEKKNIYIYIYMDFCYTLHLDENYLFMD